MADRYWFGGTNSWVSQNSGYWAASAPAGFVASQSGTTLTIASGGTPAIGNAVITNAGAFLGTITGGSGTTWTLDTSATVASTQMYAATIASYPTAAVDSVFFGYVSTGSSSLPHTVTLTSSNSCLDFRRDNNPVTIAGTGTLTIAGSLLANSSTWSQNGGITFTSTSTGRTIQTASTISSAITFSGAGGGWSLAAALTTTGAITVTQGTFTTNNYSVTATALASSNANTRAINLGSSTVTLSTGATPINFAVGTNLTFNAGTSQIICSGAGLTISGGGQTFYNLSITNTVWVVASILGSNTFNNLSVAGTTSAGTSVVSIAADQAVNGTLTLSAGSDATTRAFVRSDVIGVTRTLTVNSFAAGSADIDFRDITIAGAAAPVSGTRFGNCKGNSGITFPVAKTVYWNLAAGGNWSATGWATTGGGTPAVTNFPLAQDTTIFQSTGLNSAATVTVNVNYNIGTIDMSARTTNTMTLATGTTTPAIYGNWINGTGVTLTGTGTLTFAGRGSQTITSAGKAFTQPVVVNSPSGSVTLQDAFTTSVSTAGALQVAYGTFDANGYSVTLSGAASTVATSVSTTRTIAIGSGTWTLAGSGNVWNASIPTGLTVTGTGTISLTSASAKSFIGGGIQTYPTINQGGTGALTITGSNKFANITNTAIGSVLFTGGTTNEFTAFNLNGTSTAARLTLGSTNTTQAILKKPSTWYMGAGSLDNGNNTGLNFSVGGGIDYLAVSYINGQTTGAPPTYNAFGNFFMLF